MKKTLLFLVLLTLMLSSVHALTLGVTDSKLTEHPTLGPVWNIVAAPIGTGGQDADYIVFADADKDVKGVTEEGIPAKPEYDFTLKSSNGEQFCKYSITRTQTQAKNIYKYSYKVYPDLWPWDIQKTYDANCKADKYSYLVDDGAFDNDDLVCVFETYEAAGGDVSNGRIDFTAKFTLQREQATAVTYAFGTSGTNKDSLTTSQILEVSGKPIGVISWSGFGLSSGELCPTSVEVVGFQKAIDNKWQLGLRDRLNQYSVMNAELVNTLRDVDIEMEQDCKISLVPIFNIDCPDVTSVKHQQIMDKLKRTNDAADLALSPATKIGANTVTVSGTATEGQVTMNLGEDHLLFAPLFNIYLKTDYLKVILNVGNPEISSTFFKSCKEDGDPNLNKVVVNVINQGDATSVVQSNIFCTGGISPSTTSRQITLAPKGFNSIEFPFTVDIPSDSNVECTVSVYDKNWPANGDEFKVNTNCLAERFCFSGETRCQGTSYYYCNPQGQLVLDANNKKCMPEICKDGIDNNDNGEIDEGCRSNECNNNGICEVLLGETGECKDCRSCNGNGVCDNGENAFLCPEECGNICNNNGKCELWRLETFAVCGGKENANNECATCNNDGVCDATETKLSCATDCEEKPPFNWLWVVGGVAGAAVLALLLFQRKR